MSLKAQGTRDPDQTSEHNLEAGSDDFHERHQSFAPHGTDTLRARLKTKLPAKLEFRIHHRTALGKIHNAWLVSHDGEYSAMVHG